MFYPKIFYENMPYAYFLVCAYLLAFMTLGQFLHLRGYSIVRAVLLW
ncbi:MAG: hypothetical protein ACI9VT_000074 [Psychroserpens sp.]|jgi:hypothetical protein